jgi:hypothetical protein
MGVNFLDADAQSWICSHYALDQVKKLKAAIQI